MGLAKTGPVAGTLFFGTISSLLSKIAYEVEGTGADGATKKFQKPWFCALVMFVGMTGCLLPFLYAAVAAKVKAAKKTPATEPLLGGGAAAAPPGVTGKQLLALALPSFFDLVATVLMNTGLVWTTVSVYQMMRGSELLFAAVFSIMFLGKRLNRYHFSAIGLAIVGIGLVGLSAILGGANQAHVGTLEQQAIGMGLIALSQAVQAGQLTFEEHFMANLDINPLLLVGMEGVYGTALLAVLVLPVAYFIPGKDAGSLENTLDSLDLIKSSSSIQVVLLVSAANMCFYNISGMMLTHGYGAVFRAMLETLRTLFAWLVDMVLFYTHAHIGDATMGESWTRYSFIQVFGFVFLVSATVLYSQGDIMGAAPPAEEAPEDAPAKAAGAAPAVPASAPVAMGAASAASTPAGSYAASVGAYKHFYDFTGTPASVGTTSLREAVLDSTFGSM